MSRTGEKFTINDVKVNRNHNASIPAAVSGKCCTSLQHLNNSVYSLYDAMWCNVKMCYGNTGHVKKDVLISSRHRHINDRNGKEKPDYITINNPFNLSAFTHTHTPHFVKEADPLLFLGLRSKTG